MIEECPNCRTSVIPRQDRSCPSCQKSFDDRSEVNPDYTTVHLHRGMILPDCCLGCGQDTRVKVKISRSGENPNYTSKAGLGGSGLAALFIPVLEKVAGLGSHRLVFNIPFCPRCASNAKPKPSHVDFERFEMTFTAHRKFRASLVEANPEGH